MITCLTCQETKPPTAFEGTRNQCRYCRNESRRASHAQRAEVVNSRRRAEYAELPAVRTRRIQESRDWDEKNPEKKKLNRAVYRVRHPEVRKAQAQRHRARKKFAAGMAAADALISEMADVH